ncbi:ser thr phosphatase family protein [Colletotrichum karsti]|uniref:Ser thr phosphatase family protein n=1 Tax=Colletotrichum karsti TaxID=1095194 RepID=A0A9P6I6D1_9PEZI|nr:ser thr phosphatase family protein [Colletotrichum karsti]KAF9876577.1 ser thr phosphatase family protein [Colletotrichum karsti]
MTQTLEQLRSQSASFGNEPLLTLPNGEVLNLANGYIPLLTNFTHEDKAAKGLRKRKAGQQPETPIYFSALELVSDNAILFLTGASGSGKTTFAKHLSFALATTGLDKPSPLIRNELGDIHDEIWGGGKLLPSYFATSGLESLRTLTEHTLPRLLDHMNHDGDGVLIILDDIEAAGNEDSQRAALLIADLVPAASEAEERIAKLVLKVVEEGLLSPGDRERAGRVLSRLGDPRDLTALAEIPAGNFIMGSDNHPNSQPTNSIALGRFRIGIYPVVNKDYLAFTRQTGRDWFSVDGADPERLNAPATDLTWHDARAYCSWLTVRWRKKGKISSTEHVRLPTEPEWERASRGDQDGADGDGQVYPWGSNWRGDATNSEETGFNNTCAVGLFPKGRSPYGCYDMAGQVWEWCTTLWGKDMANPQFRYPWKHDDREIIGAAGEIRRVLRGGCFSSPQVKANCTYRGSLEPAGFWRGNGFRVVVAAEPS